MRTPRRAAVALAAAGVLSLTGLPPAAATATALSASPVSGARTTAPTRAVAVTLITGDRVLVGKGAGGRPVPMVTPAPIPGRHVAFTTMTDSKGDVRVIPSDMLPLVGSVLDERLFDVSELIRQGFDDAHARSLPLIVQHPAGSDAARGLGTVSTGAVRELTSIHSTAVREPRAGAAQGLGAYLTGAGRAALRQPSATKKLAATAGPLSGVSHIWLDGKVKATDLDWNLTKVKAPDAWDSGHTGKGVTVAVIDTGVDGTHPDLRDRITDSVNFSDSPDAGDHVGHGTHVAGTIAGSGAASDGTRKGIAPDAKLLDVKVLGDQGTGNDSGVIAGMEWAARHGAKVANMSLGGGPSDGSDPESRAVDELTARYGTLFVVAAGNEGGAVSAPGAADSALTVSATDSDDRVADFSSGGPRAGDYAFKPDVSAPGVGIVQDRAAGTSLGQVVDDHYTRLSGTSMATPHVAAAAALLAAERPELTAAQLKSLLQESSDVIGNGDQPLSVFRMGAGRLDAADAFAQRIVPDRATFDFGLIDCTANAPLSRTVKLRNTGATDATFRLDLSGNVFRGEGVRTGGPLPEGSVRLAASSVTVPAGGTADVTVVVDPRAMPTGSGAGHGGDPAGSYSGQVEATPVTGGEPLHLAFGFQGAPNQCRVPFSALDRDGNPTGGVGAVTLLDDEAGGKFAFGPGGGTMLLRRGSHFSVTGITERMLPNGHLETATMVSAEQTVEPDTKIVIDARRAHPASVKVPAATSPDLVALNTMRTTPQGHWVQLAEVAGWVNGDARFFDMYAGMVDDSVATLGRLTTTQYHHLVDARHADDPAGATTAYELAWNSAVFPTTLTRVLGRDDVHRLARVRADYRQVGAADDTNHDCVARMPSDGTQPLFYACDAVSMPVRRTEYVTPGLRWQRQTWHMGGNGYLVTALAQAPHSYGGGRRVDESVWGGPLRSTVSGAQTSDVIYMNAQDLVDTTGTTQLWWPAAYHRGAFVSVAMWRDGQLINRFYSGVGMAYNRIPDRPATWRFERQVELSGDMAQGIESTTDWEVRTTPVSAGRTAVLPLLNIDYGVRLDGWNHARPGVNLPLTLHVHRAKGAAPATVTSTRAWYSLDGGLHWIKLDVQRRGESTVRVLLKAKVLKPGQLVSLRVAAADRNGSTVDQKLIDAFHVAG
ncbi:S8 family peptidase [Streptomyces spinosirectus]